MFGIGGDTAWKLALHLRIDPYMYLQDLITKLKKTSKNTTYCNSTGTFQWCPFQHLSDLWACFNYYVYKLNELILIHFWYLNLCWTKVTPGLRQVRVQPWNSKSPTWRFVQPVACYPPPPRITKWQCPTWGSFLLPKMRSSLRQCGALAWKKWRDGWWTSGIEAFKKRDDKTIGKFVVAKNPWSIEGYNDSDDLSVNFIFSAFTPAKTNSWNPKMEVYRWKIKINPFQRVHF